MKPDASKNLRIAALALVLVWLWPGAGWSQRVRETTRQNPDGTYTRVVKDAQGRPTRETDLDRRGQPTGETRDYRYDNQGRETGFTKTNPDGTTVQRDTTYNPDGSRSVSSTTRHRDGSQSRHRFEFDNQGRITRATQEKINPQGASVERTETENKYDAQGRRTETVTRKFEGNVLVGGSKVEFKYDGGSGRPSQTRSSRLDPDTGRWEPLAARLSTPPRFTTPPAGVRFDHGATVKGPERPQPAPSQPGPSHHHPQ